MFLSVFLPVLLASLVVFRKSFLLGFGGDDYLSLLDFFKGTGHQSLFNLKFFLWQYGPQDTIFAWIYKLFGINPTPFFLISFLMRMVAAASFYPLIYSLTKSKSASFISMLFFALSLAGIETTSWSFNMFVYLVIALLNIFFKKYLQHIKKPTNKGKLLFPLFIFSLVVLAPTRLTGLIFFIPLIELFLIIKNQNANQLRISILRIALAALTILFILLIGNSIAPGENFSERFSNLVFNHTATETYTDNIGNYLHPIQQITTILIPVQDISPFEVIYDKPISKTVLYLLTFTISFLYLNLVFDNKFKIRLSLLVGLVWTLFSLAMLDSNRLVFATGASYVFTLIGGYLVILFINLYLAAREYLRIPLALGALWIVASIALFWNRFPGGVYLSDHRYLIVPLVGVCIIVGLSYNIVSEQKKLYYLIPILLLIFLQAKGTYRYLSNLSNDRSKKISQSVIADFPEISTLSESAKAGHPLVFYFTSNNPQILYHNVMFGFPAIIAITQQMNSFPNLVYTDDWKEIVSDYKTGEGLSRFNYDKSPVPVENIFSYHLDSNRLIETTKTTRDNLLNLK